MTRRNRPPRSHSARKPRVFLDSSALIAAILSPREDSASRQLLRLAEAGVVDLRASREVLRDAEYLIRKRNPALLTLLALLLEQANVTIVPDPQAETIEQCLEMTGYRPDARVLAAAVECDTDVFATYDAEHFLQNPLIGPPRTRLRVMDPFHTAQWCRAELLSSSQKDNAEQGELDGQDA